MKGRFTFTDAHGLTIATSLPLFDGVGTIKDKLQKYSACSLTLSSTFDSVIGPYDPQGPSSYPTASDVAVIAFQGQSGHGTLQVQWPGPIDSVFLGDAETVDPTAIADLIASIQTFGLMPDGGTSVGNYLWGWRRKLTSRKY
jgi:hypothetical protein